VLAYRATSPALPLMMTVLFFGFGVYLIALGTRSRITIDGTHLEVRGAFTDNSADLHEIQGYRTISSRNGKYTQIYLNNGRGTITFSSLFDRDDAFDAWFR